MGNPYDYQPPGAQQPPGYPPQQPPGYPPPQPPGYPPQQPPGYPPQQPPGNRRAVVIGAFVAFVVLVILGVLLVTSLGEDDPVPASQGDSAASQGDAGVVAEGDCGEDGRRVDLGGGHITMTDDALAVAAPAEIYPEQPPTSGPHVGQVVASGIYDVAIDPRFTTHNMEHGYVVAWYSPDSPTEQIEALQRWAQEALDGAFPKVIVAEYPQPLPGGAAVTLTAWFQLQSCDRFDSAVADAFLRAHYDTAGEAPEKGLPTHSLGDQGVVDPQGEDLLLPPLE